MRDNKRRNGTVYKKADGTFGMGPFTLEARRQILEGLLQLEIDTGLELITMGELKTIDKMWDEEGDLSKMIPELENIMDDWFETLFAAITEDLDNYFKAA